MAPQSSTRLTAQSGIGDQRKVYLPQLTQGTTVSDSSECKVQSQRLFQTFRGTMNGRHARQTIPAVPSTTSATG